MTSSLVGPSGVVRAPSSSWRYAMDDCPQGRKVLLLTSSGIAVIGQVGNDAAGYIAWAPLPDRDRDKEREAGL